MRLWRRIVVLVVMASVMAFMSAPAAWAGGYDDDHGKKDDKHYCKNDNDDKDHGNKDDDDKDRCKKDDDYDNDGKKDHEDDDKDKKHYS
jgi:Ni/Co efflux regulator RcnB